MGSVYILERTSSIRCKPDQIFRILTDVSHWNTWTKSIIDIVIVKGARLEIGSKIKVRQPKLSPAIWTVTEISKNKCIVWEKKSFGLNMTANHLIEESPDISTVKLQVIYSGFLAPVIHKMTSRLTETYLTMEITGLKEKCENALS
jgi:Polyketide cyclase / dehydrase and lipid transport